MRHLFVLNRYLWQHKYRLFFGLLFVALSNYFRVLQPQTIRYAMDTIINNIGLYHLYEGTALQVDVRNSIASDLLYFGMLTLAFALLMGIFMYFMRQTLIVMSHLIVFDLRNDIYKHYQALDTSFYKRNKTGDLMSRITEDINKVRTYLGPGIMYAVNLLIMFAMVIYAMVSVNPTLTLYSLIPLPILSVLIYFVNRIIHKKSERIQQQLSKLNSLAQEVYSGVRVVKAYAQEDAMTALFGKESDEFKQRSLALSRTDAFFRPLTMALIGTSTIVTIYVGGLLTMSGQITAGNIAEFVIYINMLTWPIISIGWVVSLIQQAAASQKRINEFLLETPSLALNPTVAVQPIQGAISFRGVSFTYKDTQICALQNINLEINKGEKIAIVGRTASGKTTLAELILRMYEVEKGEILIDNVPIADHNLAHLRQRIGYVPQDVFLFSDSVYNNIAFGKNDVDNPTIEQYAKNAAIYDEIMGLDKGFSTVVGERGVTLSGGQKQRISIARALIKTPEILIFDDCLSAVDARTEAQISAYLNEACADKTSIVITNRLYNSLRFDKIIVLDKGEITQMGTHEQLIEQKGYYAEIYELQKMAQMQ